MHTLPRSIYMSPSSAALLGFVGHIRKPPQLRTLMERFRAGALAWAVPFVAVRPAPRSPPVPGQPSSGAARAHVHRRSARQPVRRSVSGAVHTGSGCVCPGQVHSGVARMSSGREDAPELISTRSYP